MPIHLSFSSCLHTQAFDSFLWQSDICSLPFNSHSPLHPIPLPSPAITSHFILISTSSPSLCIFQPHLPLPQKFSRFATLVARFPTWSACPFPVLLRTLIVPYCFFLEQGIYRQVALIRRWSLCQMRALMNIPLCQVFLEQLYGMERLVSLAVVTMSWRKAAACPSLELPQHLPKASSPYATMQPHWGHPSPWLLPLQQSQNTWKEII